MQLIRPLFSQFQSHPGPASLRLQAGHLDCGFHRSQNSLVIYKTISRLIHSPTWLFSSVMLCGFYWLKTQRAILFPSSWWGRRIPNWWMLGVSQASSNLIPTTRLCRNVIIPIVQKRKWRLWEASTFAQGHTAGWQSQNLNPCTSKSHAITLCHSLLFNGAAWKHIITT